jgi:hypothetical protein
MDKRICGKLPEKVVKIDLLQARKEIDEILAKKGEIDTKKLGRAFEALKQA